MEELEEEKSAAEQEKLVSSMSLDPYVEEKMEEVESDLEEQEEEEKKEELEKQKKVTKKKENNLSKPAKKAEAKQKAKEAQKALDQEDSPDKVSRTCWEDFKTKEKNEGKMETEGKEKKKDEGKKGVETKKEELEANKDVEEGSSQVRPAPKLRRMNASEDLEEVMTVTVPTAPPAEAPAAPQGKEEAMQEAKDEDKDEAGAPPTKQRRLSTKTTVQSHTADDQSE